MRLSITYLFAFLATCSLTACSTTDEVAPKPESEDKTVTFEVFGNQDFSYSQYGDEVLTVQLIISRKDKYEPGAIETQVFDSTFTMPLKELPVRANRLVIKKRILAVIDDQENIFISSGYHYRQTAFGKNHTFPANQEESVVQLTVY